MRDEISLEVALQLRDEPCAGMVGLKRKPNSTENDKPFT
jgi:hypothetical protein